MGALDAVSRARGYLLPVEAYTSQGWFDREQRALFGRLWQFVGPETAVAEVGAYLTVEAGGEPLVVIRGHDGVLRAFYNLCRHRGVRLLEGGGKLSGGISCFYHRWQYGLDGQLQAYPQPEQFPGLCRENFPLKPASVEIWNGLIFVNPRPDAGSLQEWLGDMAEFMSHWVVDEACDIQRSTIPFKGNWKLFVENHLDGLHLWYLHADSVRGLDHARQVWRTVGAHWSFHQPPTPEVGGDQEREAYLSGSTVWWVMPNLAGGASGIGRWSMMRLVPIAPDETQLEIWSFTRSGPDGKAPRDPNWELIRENLDQIFAEDVSSAESIQRAMSSSAFEIGPLAKDYEAAITDFHRNVLTLMEMPD